MKNETVGATTKDPNLVRSVHVYMAGPLFGIADQLHNIMLSAELCKYPGISTILPQLESSEFMKDDKLDLVALATSCAENAAYSDVVLLNLDGPDADSGTSLEGGIALYMKVVGKGTGYSRPIVIGYRTDFRTAQDKEVGINAMFKLVDYMVYLPSYTVDSLRSATEFYKNLACSIMIRVQEGLLP